MRMHARFLLISSPFVFVFLLLYVAPALMTIQYTLVDDMFGRHFVGLENFQKLLGNKYYLLALKNTSFLFLSVPILVFFSFVLSLMMVSTKISSWQSNGVFILPLLLPSVSITMVFKALFVASESTPGVFRGLNEQSLIFLIYIWKNSGLLIVIIISGLLLIPGEYYETALLDGANYYERLRFITLPLIVPVLFFCMVLGLITNLRIFRESFLLFGAYPHDSVYLVQTFMHNHFGKLNYPTLTTSALVFGAMISLCVFGLLKAEVFWAKHVWQ